MSYKEKYKELVELLEEVGVLQDDSPWAELINNHHLESVDVKEVDGEWLEGCGNLPQRYQEIPMDKLQ